MVARVALAKSQGGTLARIGELELQIVARDSTAVLDTHGDVLGALPAQVEIAVTPSMKITRPAKGLSRARSATLAGVVNENDRGFETSLHFAKETQNWRNDADRVLVSSMEPNHRVEHEQARPHALDSLAKAFAILGIVESHHWRFDKLDVEGVEVNACGCGDVFKAPPHQVVSIFGDVHQDRAALGDGKATKARDAGRDRDGELEETVRISVCEGP